MIKFPEGFEWSTATAAHQIEGGNVNNDWWSFEHDPDSPVRVPSGDACDSWLRWGEDVALLDSLGVDSYRFSIEWSRVEPSAGEWSNSAMDNYLRLCEALLERGIRPALTLHHFTTPTWLSDVGGWTNPDIVGRFAEYASVVAERFAPYVGRFFTLNEPNVVAIMGYVLGLFPPGDPDPAKYELAVQNFVAAHHSASSAIRAAAPDAEVGLTVSMTAYEPLPGAEQQVAEAESHEDVFIDAATGDDFIGVQTYTRMVMGTDGWVGPQPGVPVISTMGYEYWPDALGTCIRRTWDRLDGNVPILVTENGTAADDNDDRVRYIDGALRSLHGCISDGIDVRGYTYWSLLDNFEWAFGYEPRFGLVQVDRTTFERTPKAAYQWLRGVIDANALPTAG